MLFDSGKNRNLKQELKRRDKRIKRNYIKKIKTRIYQNNIYQSMNWKRAKNQANQGIKIFYS